MLANTTYYWKVVTTPDHDCGWATGPVWSFTTTSQVAADAQAWSGIKALYR